MLRDESLPKAANTSSSVLRVDCPGTRGEGAGVRLPPAWNRHSFARRSCWQCRSGPRAVCGTATQACRLWGKAAAKTLRREDWWVVLSRSPRIYSKSDFSAILIESNKHPDRTGTTTTNLHRKDSERVYSRVL